MDTGRGQVAKPMQRIPQCVVHCRRRFRRRPRQLFDGSAATGFALTRAVDRSAKKSGQRDRVAEPEKQRRLEREKDAERNRDTKTERERVRPGGAGSGFAR